MTAVADTDAIKTITTHYIDGAFVRSHGHEVWTSSVPPTAESSLA
jgi:hypothetical protein